MSNLLTTTCKLCNQKFEAERIPIIGEDVAAKAQRAMKGLVEHVARKHPEHLQQIVIATTQYQTMLMLRTFTLADPALEQAASTAQDFALQQLNPSPAKVS